MYNHKVDKLIEKVKFLFDLVRLPFYFMIFVAKMLVIASGLLLAALIVYEIYNLFKYFHLSIIGSITVLFLTLPLFLGIGKAIYYITMLFYSFVGLFAIPFKYDNDLVSEIECFFEDLPYYLLPWKRDEQVQMLGFKNMEEFKKFNETHNEIFKQYDQEDIEIFRAENNIENK